MKKFRSIYTILGLIIFSTIIAGCSSNQTSKSSFSKEELINFYAAAGNGQANILNDYAKSYEKDSDYVSKTASSQIKSLNSINKKLEVNTSHKKATTDLIKLNDSLKVIAKEYKKDDFSNSKDAQNDFSNKLKNVKNDLKIDSSKNKKLISMQKKQNRTVKRLNKIATSQPHVDGKTVINSSGEIKFKNSSIVPGKDDKSVLELFYDYKNTTNEPKSALEALLASGNFTQEDGDTVVNNISPFGIADDDWSLSHQEEINLETAASAESLKPGATKEYVALLELKNTDNPIIFKAKDQDTRTSLGNIKLELNN